MLLSNFVVFFCFCANSTNLLNFAALLFHDGLRVDSRTIQRSNFLPLFFRLSPQPSNICRSGEHEVFKQVISTENHGIGICEVWLRPRAA
jgi:hypothetical protein